MQKTKPYTILLLATAALAVSACSTARDTFGAANTSPDEFAVVTRAPLEIPQELTLPTPRLGQQRPQEKTTEAQARQAVLGNDRRATSNTLSTSESVLLQKTNAHAADENIRGQVDKETQRLATRNKPVAQKLLELGGANNKPSATILDARKENARVQEAIKAGDTVTGDNAVAVEDY